VGRVAEEKRSRASAGELERVTEGLVEALRASGYIKSGAEAKVRQLVRRMELGPEDAKVWLGMLRQMVWKMRV
jgi:tRNA/rRNA methyltransferase